MRVIPVIPVLPFIFVFQVISDCHPSPVIPNCHTSHPGDLSHSSHPSYPRCSWDLSCTTLQILIWGGIVVWLLLQKNINIGWYGGYVENHASSNDPVRWDNQSKHRIHFVLPTCGASHIANKAVFYYDTTWFKPIRSKTSRQWHTLCFLLFLSHYLRGKNTQIEDNRIYIYYIVIPKMTLAAN